MKYASILMATMLYACGPTSYVTQEDFEARTSALEERVENLHLCADRRKEYTDASYVCWTRDMPYEDFQLLEEDVRADGLRPPSVEYQQELIRRYGLTILRLCDFACVFERHCQPSDTSSCEYFEEYQEQADETD
jgi:hypothetical protein